MNRRIHLLAFVATAGFFSTVAPLCGDDAPPAPMPSVISTATNSSYSQVTCTSADALACADALQLATDTRDQLAALLQLGPKWRFPVHIHIMTADDPLLLKINREASAVFSQGNGIKIEAVLPSTDPNAREFIQRQYVTALLWEKFFASTTTFDKQTKLNVVPIWLVEGLREWLNDDPEHNRESIVKRAVQNNTAPTLQEITGWNELSTDRLLGLWQRAFCYYLVNSLIQPGDRRDDFQQWLGGFAHADTTTQLHFPTEANWQQELADSSNRSQTLVYTWAETSDELTADETITFAESKDAKVQTCTLDTAITLPHTAAMYEALKERILVLTQLELRAHPGWQPILEDYRTALTVLVTENNVAEAKRLIQQGHKLRIAETANHEKLVDYINWFEVTKDLGDSTHFQPYFNTAKEMEQIEADPAHPNPIRANLLQIESEL